MKRFLILLCFLLTAGCAAQDITKPDELSKLLEMGAVLVDVRTKSEFESGHLEGALNLPHQDILQLPEIVEVSKDKPIIVYCRSGRRSGFAKNSLTEAGYRQVYNAGGYQSLKEAGL
jgi:phage shock protein E